MSCSTGKALLNLLEKATVEHDEEAQAELRRRSAQAKLVDILCSLKECKPNVKTSNPSLLSDLANDLLANIPYDCRDDWQSWCSTARKWPEKLGKHERDDKKVQIQKKQDHDVRLFADFFGKRAALLCVKMQKYRGEDYNTPGGRYGILVAVLSSLACNEHGDSVEDIQHASSETCTPQPGSSSASMVHTLNGDGDLRLPKRQRLNKDLGPPPHSNSFQNAYHTPLVDSTFNIAFISREPIEDPPGIRETYDCSTFSAVQFMTKVCTYPIQPTSCDESHNVYQIFQDQALASRPPCHPLIEAVQKQQTDTLSEDLPGCHKITSIAVKLAQGRPQEKCVVIVTINFSLVSPE